MQLLDELAGLSPQRPTILTIGVFDGVHLGHQFLVGQVAKRARELDCESGVITFHPHPRAVLSNLHPPKYISSLSERLSFITALGVDFVAPLTFTRELSLVSAEEFVEGLRERLKMRALFVGANFALGKGRKGDVPSLKVMGKELGFEVVVVAPFLLNGERVSSTGVRNALATGDVGKASSLLGRPVTLTGEVVEGDRRGRTIGFPTANIAYDPERALPADGVYATRAYLKETSFDAVTNIGVRPTFNGRQRTVEVFLLDFAGDIYHQQLRIELIERLRGEVRFTGVDDLKAQIRRDVERAGVALKR